ncbi:DUF4394 domain-containing protein [Pseudonocardia sp. KRD-182]|uniref:DUF4394 domain-containing protein n=1 Tax=Pseudonocardia oceani TaxID=2792013 RepID=UPI001C49EDD2|nr:DUF4394 domain-containing protein [Pseudonocardia oceani]MBW0108243.1 DUF4394 domain-containing protein [Pseudonocardia oceani]
MWHLHTVEPARSDERRGPVVRRTGRRTTAPAFHTEGPNPAVAPATDTTPAVGVTAVGYTNNDDAAGTATTLFAVDTTADRVAIQSPANAGTLAPTGGLGVDAGTDARADIYTAGAGNRAFATLEVSGTRGLFEVDLLTGAVEHLGALDGITDIVLPIDQG